MPRAIVITAKVLAGIICAVAAVWFAGVSASIGAGVGGLKEGGWNWQFLPSLYIGWLLGFLLTAGLSIYIFIRRIPWFLQLITILLTPPLTTFALSSTYYFFTLMPQRIQEAKNSKFLTEARNEPAIIDRLVERARFETLSPIERIAIWDSLWKRNRFTHEETVFLLDYFREDISAVAGIMTYQPVKEDDLRLIFTRYDNTQAAFTRIYDELIKHPATPIDILHSIAINPRCPDYMKKKANEAITKRSNKALHPTATRVTLPAVASLLSRKRATGSRG